MKWSHRFLMVTGAHFCFSYQLENVLHRRDGFLMFDGLLILQCFLLVVLSLLVSGFLILDGSLFRCSFLAFNVSLYYTGLLIVSGSL